MRSSSAFRPQTNGQAERANQTMKQVFRTLIAQGRLWYDMLDSVEIAMNSAPVAWTDYSPYYLTYGYHPTFLHDLPVDWVIPWQARYETARDFVHRMRSDWKTVRKAFKHQQEKVAAQANRHRTDHPFMVGDQVLLNMTKHFRRQMCLPGPLALRAAGPYQIVRQLTPTSFALDLPPTMDIHNSFHSNELIPYEIRLATPGISPYYVTDIPEDETEGVAMLQNPPTAPLLLDEEPDVSILRAPLR